MLPTRVACYALPLEQEAHEIRGPYWLDLGAQRADSVTVYAGEQATLAPLSVVRPRVAPVAAA
jgi:hypothetical protein